MALFSNSLVNLLYYSDCELYLFCFTAGLSRMAWRTMAKGTFSLSGAVRAIAGHSPHLEACLTHT